MKAYQEAAFLQKAATKLLTEVAADAKKPPSVERAYGILCRAKAVGVDTHESDLSLISLCLLVVAEWCHGIDP